MAFPNRSGDSESLRPAGRKPLRAPSGDSKYGARKGLKTKPAPPELTNAENFYYLKQMSSKTPMVILMTDGEEIHGWIEWYDRNCLKVNREGAPNLLVQKHCIKYLFKAEDRVDSPRK